MVTDSELLERRQDRIEDAIEKLVNISADLNKMIAVQEQRLSQHERAMAAIEISMENRRIDLDKKLNVVYDTMRKEDRKILDKLESMEKEHTAQHKELSMKISSLERIIWTYLGGFSVIVFVLSYGPKILEIFTKLPK